MNLQYLLSPWIDVDLQSIDILHIENDSRKVVPGTLFFAYPGYLVDGRNYISSAIEQGAVAVVYESTGFALPIDEVVPCIGIDGLKDKLAAIAARFYANPSNRLKVIGITGTNGKTTVAYQLAAAYSALDEKSAYIGTIGQGLIGNLKTLANTTPDGMCLQKLFATYLKQRVTTVCMEVSSHALCEGRVNNIDFVEAIYTNLSREHLDYHKTMLQYAAAKAQLFTNTNLQRAVINIDDQYANIMLAACPEVCEVFTYGFSEEADFQAYAAEFNLSGCRFKVKSRYANTDLACKGIGSFNIYNSLAIFVSLVVSGYAVSQVVKVIGNLDSVSGRMELVAKRPYVFIDYSHTPDALENALQSLVNLQINSDSKGKVWVVFGCGGDRDPGKRALMGKVASRLADNVIVTSDNPRTEDPLQIINDIMQGIDTTKNCQQVIDREEAIISALRLAQTEDSILIAGKGHEDYQIIKDKKIHFSDKEVVLKTLLVLRS